jgi:hypothetical protein
VHVIQQFLVFEKYRETNGKFLQHHPLEIYKALGEVEEGTFSPWYLMYDHPDDCAFVSAQSLTEAMTDDAGKTRWPTTSMLVSRSKNKVNEDFADRMRRKHQEEFDGAGVVKRHF